MNDFDEDGSSIILSQLHQQEIEEIQKTVNNLTKENLNLGMNIIDINISPLVNNPLTFDLCREQGERAESGTGESGDEDDWAGGGAGRAPGHRDASSWLETLRPGNNTISGVIILYPARRWRAARRGGTSSWPASPATSWWTSSWTTSLISGNVMAQSHEDN